MDTRLDYELPLHRLVPKWVIFHPIGSRLTQMGHLEETIVDRARPTLYNGGEGRTVETLAVDEHYRDLLLCEQLSDDAIHELLSPVGFADWRAAYGCLLRMAGESSAQAGAGRCAAALADDAVRRGQP